MARIYTSQSLAAGQLLALEPGPSRHLVGALRLRTGDEFTVFNGSGGEYCAVVTEPGKNVYRQPWARISSASRNPRYPFTWASPFPAASAWTGSSKKVPSWVSPKLPPLFTERTEVKLKGARADKKLAHWQQVVISACEQCGRNTLPRLNQLQPLDSWCDGPLPQPRLVLHHRGDNNWQAGAAPTAVTLLNGPEGGLSESEIRFAQNHDFKPLTLGPRVLRTETAPLAAIAILQARWGDMN